MHKNTLDQLHSAVVLTLVSGLELPLATAIVSLLYGFSRFLYMVRHTAGFLLGVGCMAVLAIGALFSSIKLIAEVSAL